ncbi:MAG: helix-turn-helix transcriptional regulator [Thermoleophilaceae bacterium]
MSQELARLATLGEPVRRRLYDYVRGSSDPVSREEAAEAVGISRSLAAYHLDRLAEHALLAISYRRPEGRSGPGAGRPAKLYTAQGEVSVSVPPRDYELAADLLAEAAEESGEARAALHTVAARAGRRLGEGLGEGRKDSLEDALAARGYEPFEDEAGVIRLGNCPFHRLAVDHRDVVCGMNLAYLQGLLEGLDRGDVTGGLEPEPGRCCVAIRARRRSGPEPAGRSACP